MSVLQCQPDHRSWACKALDCIVLSIVTGQLAAAGVVTPSRTCARMLQLLQGLAQWIACMVKQVALDVGVGTHGGSCIGSG